MSCETRESPSDFKRITGAYEKGILKKFPTEEAYLKADAEFRTAHTEFQRKHKRSETPNPRPDQPMGARNFRRPSGLNELMFSQTTPYILRGIIWYQGEATCGPESETSTH